MTETRTPLLKRRPIQIAAVAIAVPVLAVAWWLLSPLFLNQTVIEDFPLAASAQVPDDMTIEEVEAEMEDAAGTNEESTEPMPADGAAEPVAIASGEFVGADAFHQGSGSATIYELGDGSRVLRLEDFDVTNGPDLHVLLSPVANPESRDDVMAAGYIDLGELKGNRGAQNYDIPADFEIPNGEFSIVIYCVPFHVLFASATVG